MKQLKHIPTAVKILTSTVISSVLNTGIAKAVELNIDSLDNTPDNPGDIIGAATNTLLTAAGVISVIMIIVGGIMYALSAGDSGKAGKAKDTILYSVIGLAITMLAYAIVNFVIKAL